MFFLIDRKKGFSSLTWLQLKRCNMKPLSTFCVRIMQSHEQSFILMFLIEASLCRFVHEVLPFSKYKGIQWVKFLNFWI